MDVAAGMYTIYGLILDFIWTVAVILLNKQQKQYHLGLYD